MTRSVSARVGWLFLLAVSTARAADVIFPSPPGPIELTGDSKSPASSAELIFTLPAEQPPEDLAVELTCDKQSPIAPTLIVEANGSLVARMRFKIGETANVRIPRLFLKGGPNTLRFQNTTGIAATDKVLLAAPMIPSHRIVVDPAAASHAAAKPPPRPAVWGEVLYDWKRNTAILWVTVQGEGRRALAEAGVAAEALGLKKPMTLSKTPGHSALASAVQTRFEAEWPLDSLKGGSTPVKIDVACENYSPATAWFQILKPSKETATDNNTQIHAVSLSGKYPQSMAFRTISPAGSFIPPPDSSLTYDRLMNWIEQTRPRDALVMADRAGQTLGQRFGEFLHLLDVDGWIVHDDKGWDPAIEPGGAWDQQLHQRQNLPIHSALQMNVDRRHPPAWIGEGQWSIELAAPNRTVIQGSRVPISAVIATPNTMVKIIQVIGDSEGVPGTILSEQLYNKPEVHFQYNLTVNRPCYVRLMIEARDGRRALTKPFLVDVRPKFADRVVKTWGEPDAFEKPPAPAPGPVQMADKTLPILLGKQSCASLKIPLAPTPEGEGYSLLEIGVDPLGEFDGPHERIEFLLNGKHAGDYKAFNTIHGQAIRHLVPVRIPLGKLAGPGPHTLELRCAAGGDGIALSYAYLLHTALPALAMVDAHSHSKIEEDFSFPLHRTMGYNLISTGHGPFGAAAGKSLQRATELSDAQLTIQIGGERQDYFAGAHASMIFLDAKPEQMFERDSKYFSTLPLALEWNGIMLLNHPYQDSRLTGPGRDPTWGTNDSTNHGFAGWAPRLAQFGMGDYYWRLLTHFEYLNGYSKPGVCNGKQEDNPAPRTRWHEQLSRYVRGERRTPLFAAANTDTKTFQQNEEKTNIGSMYMASMVHSQSIKPQDIEAAFIAGHTTLGGHADVRLLASVSDSAGNVYHPGNHLPGPGVYQVRIEAWSPRELALVRVVGPLGVIVEKKVAGKHVVETLPVESPGAWDWFMVEIRGDAAQTGALSNPFLRTAE